MQVLTIRNSDNKKTEYLKQILNEKKEVLVSEDETATHVLILTKLENILEGDIVCTDICEESMKEALEYFVKDSHLYVAHKEERYGLDYSFQVEVTTIKRLEEKIADLEKQIQSQPQKTVEYINKKTKEDGQSPLII